MERICIEAGHPLREWEKGTAELPGEEDGYDVLRITLRGEAGLKFLKPILNENGESLDEDEEDEIDA